MSNPFVRRRRLAAAEDTIARLELKVRDQQRACASLGHARDNAYRDAAKLITDMRLVRVHVESGYTRAERFALAIEFPDYVFESFRYDKTFRETLSYMVEDAIMREPDTRRSMLAGVRP